MRAVSDVIRNYQHVISDLQLVMGAKGVFDVEVDDTLVYSKAATGRHAEPGEVLARVRDHLGPDVPVYER